MLKNYRRITFPFHFSRNIGKMSNSVDTVVCLFLQPTSQGIVITNTRISPGYSVMVRCQSNPCIRTGKMLFTIWQRLDPYIAHHSLTTSQWLIFLCKIQRTYLCLCLNSSLTICSRARILSKIGPSQKDQGVQYAKLHQAYSSRSQKICVGIQWRTFQVER